MPSPENSNESPDKSQFWETNLDFSQQNMKSKMKIVNFFPHKNNFMPEKERQYFECCPDSTLLTPPQHEVGKTSRRRPDFLFKFFSSHPVELQNIFIFLFSFLLL